MGVKSWELKVGSRKLGVEDSFVGKLFIRNCFMIGALHGYIYIFKYVNNFFYISVRIMNFCGVFVFSFQVVSLKELLEIRHSVFIIGPSGCVCICLYLTIPSCCDIESSTFWFFIWVVIRC